VCVCVASARVRVGPLPGCVCVCSPCQGVCVCVRACDCVFVCLDASRAPYTSTLIALPTLPTLLIGALLRDHQAGQDPPLQPHRAHPQGIRQTRRASHRLRLLCGALPGARVATLVDPGMLLLLLNPSPYACPFVPPNLRTLSSLHISRAVLAHAFLPTSKTSLPLHVFELQPSLPLVGGAALRPRGPAAPVAAPRHP
jgi:hypothetical protein